jgi:hypothetical protein
MFLQQYQKDIQNSPIFEFNFSRSFDYFINPFGITEVLQKELLFFRKLILVFL